MTAKTMAKVLLGTGAELLFPSVVRQIEAGVTDGGNRRLKRWILLARLERAKWRKDSAATSAVHGDIWKVESGAGFYDRYSERFRKWFFGPHQVIVDRMVALNAERHFTQLIEIGCGDGQALAHCAARMPEIGRLVGIDINAAIIERNRASHAKDPRLTFVAGNAAEWVIGNAAPGTLLFSYGGVMEYFDPGTLSRMFAALAGKPNVAVALVEPVDPAHDLAADPASHQFGQEQSFSHNHASLLAEAGFEITFRDDIRIDGVRWILLLAARPAGR